MFERRGVVGRHFKCHCPVVVANPVDQLIQAVHGALAPLVDHQIARNGKQPGLKSRLAVKLSAAHQHPHPDFLKQVFGKLPIPGQEEQVAQQPVLIAHNQLIQQPCLAPFQPFGNGKAFPPSLLVGSYGRFSKEWPYRSDGHLSLLDDINGFQDQRSTKSRPDPQNPQPEAFRSSPLLSPNPIPAQKVVHRPENIPQPLTPLNWLLATPHSLPSWSLVPSVPWSLSFSPLLQSPFPPFAPAPRPSHNKRCPTGDSAAASASAQTTPPAPAAVAGRPPSAPAVAPVPPPSPALADLPSSPRASSCSPGSSVRRPISQSHAASSRSSHRTISATRDRCSAPVSAPPATESRVLPDPAPARSAPSRRLARRRPPASSCLPAINARRLRDAETTSSGMRLPRSRRAPAAPCALATPSPRQRGCERSSSSGRYRPAPAPP